MRALTLPRAAILRPVLVTTLVALLCSVGPVPADARPRLLVVSIDGLYPEAYLEPAARGLEIPHLMEVVASGVSAESVIGIFPSTTYPTHATLITGVRPARHGVTANAFFNPARGSKDMYWFASGLRVPTLAQVAHDAGFRVASIQWPCLADAPYVDWRIPEIWSVDPSTTNRELTMRFATSGLVERIEERFGAWTEDRFTWGKHDDRITDAAVALIELEQPEVMFVHIIEVDHVMHEWGRDSRQGLAAIERADGHLGRILDALEAAGLREETNVVILSDHGFASIHSVLRPNVILAELGLVEVPGKGDAVESWQALFHTSAAAGALYLREPTDAAARDRAYRRFQEMVEGRYRGLFRLLDRDELEALGAFPGAEFGICANVGYDLSAELRGDFVDATTERGQHGYLPEVSEMHAAFIAEGPAFRPSFRIPELRMIDVAPSLAAVLGVDMGEQVEGIAVPGLLRVDEHATMEMH